jgi:hypothetical protein
MALHWRPVGPEPAQTYWLRRAVVAAAVLLVVVLLLQLLRRRGDDDRLAQSRRTPRPRHAGADARRDARPERQRRPSATPDPSASAAPCADDVLQRRGGAATRATPSASSRGSSCAITNTGATPCSRDLGQAAVELQVVSGDDRIWSSDDCAQGGEPEITVLQPGEAKTSTVSWPGTRSRPGCQGDDEPADAGTYRVIGGSVRGPRRALASSWSDARQT